MENFEKLKEEILKKIKPTEEEIKKIKKIADEFGEILKNLGINYYFGGSFAKDTFLKNITDIDVYLLMKKEEDLDEIKEKLINSPLDVKVLHGSRDYFQTYFKGLLFEMVPVLDIKSPEEAKNSTDISKFHVEFVKSKIKENPNLKDEILLMKYFLKQKGLYGAESYNNGFSGYLSEVLVIYLGSFLDVIKFFSNKKIPIYIPKFGDELKKKLKKQGKLNDYFNVLDPVLKERNLGMAVSKDKVAELIFRSNEFLKNPNFEKVSKEKELFEFYKKLSKKYILLKLEFTDFFKNKYNNPDIIGSKMKNEGKNFANFLKKNNFDVIYELFVFDKNNKEGKYYILTERFQSIKEVEGPFVWLENLNKFIYKHKDDLILIKNFRAYSFTPKNLEIKEFLKSFKSEKFKIKFYE